MTRARTTLLAGLLAGQLLALPGPATPATPATAATAGSATVPGPGAVPVAVQAASASSVYGSTAFDATNDERVKRDRRVLRPSACLGTYAARQARRMANRERIWHQDLQRILADCNMRLVGENVAAGFPSGRSVVTDGWMESPSHRANLLERRFRLMKVVARKGDDGRWYAAQVFGQPA